MIRNRCINKLLITLTWVFLLILITVWWFSEPKYVDDEPDNPPQFYRSQYLRRQFGAGLSIDEADKIEPELVFKTPIRGEKNIIFLETSCATKDISTMAPTEIKLSYQKVCAIESTAKTNPKSKIYIFYTCPLDQFSLRTSTDLVRRLFTNPNIRIWHQNMTSYFRGTPLEDFYNSGQLQRSDYASSHASDVLRYLSLWKYGGIYLDLDFIIIKSLHPLGRNFAGAEDEFYIAAGATGLSATGIGKDVAEACVEEVRTNFRGDIWNHNGPGVISRVMQRRCGTDEIYLMTERACRGFVVYPPTVFYAVSHGSWKDLFSEDRSAKTMTRIGNSTGVHLWNSKAKIQPDYPWNSVSKEMVPGSRQPVALLREKYCPQVYRHIEIAKQMGDDWMDLFG